MTSPANNRLRPPAISRNGISLIVVLGLLSILTLLATAFSLSMRMARQEGRGHVDQVKSAQLLDVALHRAMTDIDSTMAGYCYPYWGHLSPGGSADALCSTSTTGQILGMDILRGEASNHIPMSLWFDVTNAAFACGWRPVITPSGSTNGRVAYLIANCSGLVDANWLGNIPSSDALNIAMAMAHSDIFDLNIFTSNHLQLRRYETVPEMPAINPGLYADPVSNLFVYSYDPEPNQYFTDATNLGSPTITLLPKMNVNTADAGALSNCLWNAGFTNTAASIAANIIEYRDGDHLPANGGVEAVPLINELSLELVGGTNYLTVELWYPFYPPLETNSFVLDLRFTTNGTAPVLFSTNLIGQMEFGNTNSEFLCFTGPIELTGPLGTAALQLQCSVRDGAAVLDEVFIGPITNTPAHLSINDPRLNDQSNLWVEASATLGAMNSVCDPWAGGGQGLPIYHRNGAMEMAGEIGYIFTGRPWQTIDILSTNNLYGEGGALLMDWITTGNNSRKGRISPNSQQIQPLRAFFHTREIGHIDTLVSTNLHLTDSEGGMLADALLDSTSTEGTFYRLSDALQAIGTSMDFQTWSPGGTNHTGSDLKEDAVRHLAEMVTFRQNLFTIILAAQSLSTEGHPTAETRSMVILYRDAYTGRFFTVFQKRLNR